MKRTLILALALVLSCVMAVTGTIAYLSDTDEDVNVMTLGNVDIEQLEFERVDTEVIPGELRAFTADKPLYPVYAGPATTAETAKQDWDTIGLDSESELLPLSIIGDVDKFVFVKNIGTSDAYVRTWFAFEQGEVSAATHSELIKTLTNSTDWTWSEAIPDMLIKRGETSTKYVVYSATYNKALPAGAMTEPSLLQLYLSSDAASADCLALDGNGNGRYDVIVLSQAVQTTNFDDAETALNAAFNVENPFANNNATITPDTWNADADTSWYNENDTLFEIGSAKELAGLAELVSAGNTFEGKTIRLVKDIDLYKLGDDGEPVTFDPIGDGSPFAGTFDGLGHTIYNLYQSGWALGYDWDHYGSLGLFGELKSATVKNLTLSGSECFVEGGDVSAIAGSATGTCVFENITLTNCDIATYNNGCGGLIGWSGAGNYTFKNITIEDDVVLAGLWGSFDSSIGGIVGQGEPGATYNFENVDIKCRLDVYNDCTASYDYYNYRMCGMLIGRLQKTTTIDGANYPDTSKYDINCSNVTVTYGDWANYHYCDPTPGLNNGRGMRVEPGYSYDGIPADYDHSQCTSHCNELIPFDQIFGGDQYGVKGLKTHDGVTVTYNNK